MRGNSNTVARSAMNGGVMKIGVTSKALTILVASLVLSSAMARTIRESAEGPVEFDMSLLVDPKTLVGDAASEDVPLASGDRRQLQADAITLAPTCADQLSYCASWSLSGYCGASYTSNGYSVADYWCPKSCNGLVCRPPPSPGACADLTSWCAGWSSSGYCTYLYAGVSIKNVLCKQTCGAAGCGAPKSPPPSSLSKPPPPTPPPPSPPPPSSLSKPPPPTPPPPSPPPPSSLPKPPPPSPPPPLNSSAGCVDESATLTSHNNYRAIHSAGAMVWNATLAQMALVWAKNLTATGACNMVHASSADRGGAGENLYMAMNSRGITRSCTAASTAWYNEVASYKFTSTPWTDNSPTFGSIGHFTQLVWIGTKQLGCAAASPANVNTCYVVVCRYAPAGNIATDGYFASNVLKGSYSG